MICSGLKRHMALELVQLPQLRQALTHHFTTFGKKKSMNFQCPKGTKKKSNILGKRWNNMETCGRIWTHTWTNKGVLKGSFSLPLFARHVRNVAAAWISNAWLLEPGFMSSTGRGVAQLRGWWLSRFVNVSSRFAGGWLEFYDVFCWFSERLISKNLLLK